MTKLLMIGAAASLLMGLSGCVVAPAPYGAYSGYGYGEPSYSVYYSNGGGDYNRGYRGHHHREWR